MVQQRSIERLRVPERYTWSGDRQRSMRCSLRAFYVQDFPEFAWIRGDSTLNLRQD